MTTEVEDEWYHFLLIVEEWDLFKKVKIDVEKIIKELDKNPHQAQPLIRYLNA